MEDFELLYDVENRFFIEEDSGYTLYAEFIMINDDRTVMEEIYAGTGAEVDELYVETLRDVIEMYPPTFPFGN